MAEEGKKFGDKEAREFIKDYNKDNYGEETSDKEISEANHQARNDYQDSGEPFGSLDKRDRSTKTDVPEKDYVRSNPGLTRVFYCQ